MKNMKSITLFLLVGVGVVVLYPFQKPILTQEAAIIQAKQYVNVINKKKNRRFDTEKLADYSVLDEETVWNKTIGNRQWTVMIDGVAVDINAYSGKLVQMVFPLDGVISELPE